MNSFTCLASTKTSMYMGDGVTAYGRSYDEL